MGSAVTKTSTGPHSPESIKPFMLYLCNSKLVPASVDPDVSLVVKTSTLSSGFIHGKHRGLFTENSLTKGTIICAAENPLSLLLNDGLIDLEPVIRADSSQKLYDALNHMEKTYYDLERASKVVNTVMLGTSNGMFLESIQDIPAGAELIRMYGFTTWTNEFFELITNHNVAGFAKFIFELKDRVNGDPYERRIISLNKVLVEKFLPNVADLNLVQYDTEQASIPLKYIGKEIEQGANQHS